MPSTMDYHHRPRSRGAASSKHSAPYYDGPTATTTRFPSVTRKRSTSNPEELHVMPSSTPTTTRSLPRVSTMHSQPLPPPMPPPLPPQPSPMYSRSNAYEGSRNYPAPPSSRFFLTVIPPIELPLDPPHPRSTAASAGSSSHARRGTLVPLYPTLGGQLYAIAREYGLPSIGGLAIYLCDDGEGNLGPRIGDSTWSALWARHFDEEWGSQPTSMEYSPPSMMHHPPLGHHHEREPSSSSSSGDWRPPTAMRGSQAATTATTATTSNRASPMPYVSNIGGGVGGATPSPRYARAHHSLPRRTSAAATTMGMPPVSSSPSPLFGGSSRLPIVGRVEWTVDRHRAPWWSAWVAEAEASSNPAASLSSQYPVASTADRSSAYFSNQTMPLQGVSAPTTRDRNGLVRSNPSQTRRSLFLRGGNATSRQTPNRSEYEDYDVDAAEIGDRDEIVSSGSPLARRLVVDDARSLSRQSERRRNASPLGRQITPSQSRRKARSSFADEEVEEESSRSPELRRIAAASSSQRAESRNASETYARLSPPGMMQNHQQRLEDEERVGDEFDAISHSQDSAAAKSIIDHAQDSKTRSVDTSDDADDFKRESAREEADATAASYVALEEDEEEKPIESQAKELLNSGNGLHSIARQSQHHDLLDVARPTSMGHKSADADGGSTAGFGSYNGYSALLDVDADADADEEKAVLPRSTGQEHAQQQQQQQQTAESESEQMPSFEVMPDSDEGMWMDLQRHSNQLRLSAELLSEHARTPKGPDDEERAWAPSSSLSSGNVPRSSSVQEWISKTGRHVSLQPEDDYENNGNEDEEEENLLPPQDDVQEVLGLWAHSNVVFPTEARIDQQQQSQERGSIIEQERSRESAPSSARSSRQEEQARLVDGRSSIGSSSSRSRGQQSSSNPAWASPSITAPLALPPKEALPPLPSSSTPSSLLQQQQHSLQQAPKATPVMGGLAAGTATASLLSPIALDSSPGKFSGPSAQLGGLAMSGKRSQLVDDDDEEEEEKEEEVEKREEKDEEEVKHAKEEGRVMQGEEARSEVEERRVAERMDSYDQSCSSVDSNAVLGLGTSLPPSSQAHSLPLSSPRLELPSMHGSYDEESRRSSLTEQSDTLLDMERALALLSPNQSPAMVQQQDGSPLPTPNVISNSATASSNTNNTTSSRDSFAKAKSLSTSVSPSPRWLKAGSAAAFAFGVGAGGVTAANSSTGGTSPLNLMPRSLSTALAQHQQQQSRPTLHRGGSRTPPAKFNMEDDEGTSSSSNGGDSDRQQRNESTSLAALVKKKLSSSPRPASSPAAAIGAGRRRIVSQDDPMREQYEQQQQQQQDIEMDREMPSLESHTEPGHFSKTALASTVRDKQADNEGSEREVQEQQAPSHETYDRVHEPSVMAQEANARLSQQSYGEESGGDAPSPQTYRSSNAEDLLLSPQRTRANNPVLSRQSPSNASETSRYDDDDDDESSSDDDEEEHHMEEDRNAHLEPEAVADEWQGADSTPRPGQESDGGDFKHDQADDAHHVNEVERDSIEDKEREEEDQMPLLGTQGWSETTGDQSRSISMPLDESNMQPIWRSQEVPPPASAHESTSMSTPTIAQNAFAPVADPVTPMPPTHHSANAVPNYVTVGVQADQSPLTAEDFDRDSVIEDDYDEDDEEGEEQEGEQGNFSRTTSHHEEARGESAYQHGRDDSLFSLVSMGGASETMDHSESAPDVDGSKPSPPPPAFEPSTSTEDKSLPSSPALLQQPQQQYQQPPSQEQSQTVMAREQRSNDSEQRPSIERFLRGNSFAESYDESECSSALSSKAPSPRPSPAMVDFEFPKRTTMTHTESPKQLKLAPLPQSHEQPVWQFPPVDSQKNVTGHDDADADADADEDNEDDDDDDDVWSQEGSHDEGGPRRLSEIEGALTPTFFYDTHLANGSGPAISPGATSGFGFGEHLDAGSARLSTTSTVGGKGARSMSGGGTDDLDAKVDQMLDSVESHFPDEAVKPHHISSSSSHTARAAASPPASSISPSASAPTMSSSYAPFLEQMNLDEQMQQPPRSRFDNNDVSSLAAALVSPTLSSPKRSKVIRRPSSLSASTAGDAGTPRRASASSIASSPQTYRNKASSPLKAKGAIQFDPPPAVTARGGAPGFQSPAAPTRPTISTSSLGNMSPRQRFGALPPSPRQFPPHVFDSVKSSSANNNSSASTYSPSSMPPLASSMVKTYDSPFGPPTLVPSLGPYAMAQTNRTPLQMQTPPRLGSGSGPGQTPSPSKQSQSQPLMQASK